MEDNAMISICNRQEIDGESDAIELETMGKFAIKNNKIYIIYKESELTGYEGTTTTIKISDGSVSIRRSGTYRSNMTYTIGEPGLCFVDTPYGQVAVMIMTDDIKSSFNDCGGVLNMNYVIDPDNQTFIKNDITIKVTAVARAEV